MTTSNNVKSNSIQRAATAGVLIALCALATSCATADDDAALVEIGERAEVEAPTTSLAETAVPGTVDTATPEVGAPEADTPLTSIGFEDIEYGTSLEDLTHASAQSTPTANISLPGYRTIEWDELIPPGFTSEEIFARYEERLTAAERGSPELDALYDEMTAESKEASANPDLVNADVQLAGFVAPLAYDGDRIIEFLLVPYFGACIHVPAPPANQTVMVTLTEGESISLEESWGAIWVAGTMTANATDTDLATAGYSIAGAQFGIYRA